MRKKILFETNPYSRDVEKYEKSLITNVGSSTAIELGTLPKTILQALKAYKVSPIQSWTISGPTLGK